MNSELHPIQLTTIKVLELQAILKDINYEPTDGEEWESSFTTGHTEFDEEQSAISVGVIAKVGATESSPFFIKVHLLGTFSVGDEFPKDKIYNWASQNAPVILYPYLREHVYSLAMRAGVKEVILPLFVVPTFKA